MKVVYLLRGTTLYGGVKVPFQHVRELRRLGIEAEAVSPEAPRPWYPGMAPLHRRVAALTPEAIGSADVAIAAHWSLVRLAMEIPGAIPVQFCQGYEGIFEFMRDDWPAIDDVYRLPTVKWAVSKYLVDLIGERFDREATFIPQPLAPTFFAEPPAPPSKERFRVLVTGQWADPSKGVTWALPALRPLLDESPPIELVRLTQFVPPEELELWPDVERHVHVPIDQVPRIYREVDLVVVPSHEAEGWGLPCLEALGSGRPAVTSDISAFRELDPDQRASRRVPYGDAEALRNEVRRLRDDPALRQRLGEEGRRLASAYPESRTRLALERALGAIVTSRPSA